MTATAWKLPGYLVQQQLGAGGSGQVWQARERSTGDEVAVKLLPAVERGHLDAVRSEAAMLSGLDHPHLLHLREVVQCGAGLALVVDLADGGSLAELLDSRGRIAPGEVVTAIAPIGAALAYAHNAGVVHGDVSASNLLFTEIGFPLLADLGVARLVGDDAPVSSTPAYLDPAVAAGGVPSAASDVFMLGAVALHALTGEPAWRGVTAEEALIAARAGDLGDLPARMNAARVPGEVADVVSRALELEASRRPTAAEFALDLRHATEPVAVEFGAGRAADRDSDAGGRPRADRSTFTHHMRPEPRRPAPKGLHARLPRSPCLSLSPRLIGSATAVLVALAAVAAALWWPRGSARPPQRAAHASPSVTTNPLAAAAPSGPVGAPAKQPSTRATPPPAHTVPLTAAAAARVLAGLDETRARAFAQRSPALLASVYPAGALRSQDAAMINKIVPAGCGLYGVHTAYTYVSVTSRAATRVVVTVNAALAPSTLECSGRPAGKAAGTKPTRLRIVLLRSGRRYLMETVTH